ncbi:MAG: hypothetical protein HYX94_00390 [Chloroflexi bacterium]|nr:hypothetical protein [Chloroflexota bacterium]
MDSIDIFLDNTLVRKYVFQYAYKRPWWHRPSSDTQDYQAQNKLVLTAIYQGIGPVGVVDGNVASGNYLPPVRFTYYDSQNEKLHLKTVTNELLGGTITYTYQRYIPEGWQNLKYRYRVSNQRNDGGVAGSPAVTKDFKYRKAWQSTGEFRGHDDVAVVDGDGHREVSRFFSLNAVNGKTAEDVSRLRGKTWKELTFMGPESSQTVQNYATDLQAALYTRSGWTDATSKMAVDTTNQLRFRLVAGTTYNANEQAAKKYLAPSGCTITKVEFDYEANYDNSNFLLAMDVEDSTGVWTDNAYGVTSGHVVFELPGGSPWVSFGLYCYNTLTYPDAGWNWFGRIYNLTISYYPFARLVKDNTWNLGVTQGDARHLQLTQVDETLEGSARRTSYAYTDDYGNLTDVYGYNNVSRGLRGNF